MRQVDLELRGLGVILYSPPAVAHIPEGSDYLREHFWEPDDVARHVMECQLTAFCTGSPGSYRLRFFNGPPDESAVRGAAFKLRLGLRVLGGAICVRDLYDLMQWCAECPAEQQFSVPDGWYRLTVASSPPVTRNGGWRHGPSLDLGGPVLMIEATTIIGTIIAVAVGLRIGWRLWRASKLLRRRPCRVCGGAGETTLQARGATVARPCPACSHPE